MLAEGRCSPTATMILSSHRLVMRVTRESCAHEGSLADLGMRFCGLLAEVTRPRMSTGGAGRRSVTRSAR